MADEMKLPTDEYIAHMKEVGKIGGAASYDSMLRRFQKYLRDKVGITIEQATSIHVEQFLATIDNGGSMNVALAAIRGYFKYRYSALPMGDPSLMVEMQRYNQMENIRPSRREKKLEKKSLTPRELKNFLAVLKAHEANNELYAGVIVNFYFGGRPVEMASKMASARISLKERKMFIQTAKTQTERYLTWHPKMDPYMQTWYEFMHKDGKKGLPYPGAWLTKSIKNLLGSDRKTGGVIVTARTARRTFETQMRLNGVPDIAIRAVLGHTDTSMSDVYTDWTQFVPVITKAMVEDHYMITGKVL